MLDPCDETMPPAHPRGNETKCLEPSDGNGTRRPHATNKATVSTHSMTGQLLAAMLVERLLSAANSWKPIKESHGGREGEGKRRGGEEGGSR